MTDEQKAPETPEPEPTLNIDDAVADIADALQLAPAEEEKEQAEVAAPPDDAAKQEDKALAAEAAKSEQDKAAAVAADPNDRAPDTWRKEAKEAWQTVPPVVKEELRKREGDIARYVESTKQPIAVAETFTKVVEPYLPMFEKYGVNPWDNIAAALKAQEILLFGAPEQKLAMLTNLAQQSGLKLEGNQLSAPASANQQYVAQLEARLARLEGGVKTVTGTVQEARRQELEGHIMAFANDKEAHPFFEEVASGITHLISTGAAGTLQDAYDLAVMANPVTRTKAIEAETARAATQKAAAEAERVAKAKQAAKVNVKSQTSRRPAPATGSIDDTLKETLAAINAR